MLKFSYKVLNLKFYVFILLEKLVNYRRGSHLQIKQNSIVYAPKLKKILKELI